MIKNINIMNLRPFLKRFGIFAFLLTGGLSVFFVNITYSNALPNSIRLTAKFLICIIYLFIGILIKNNKALRSIFLTFFTASASILISWLLSVPILHLFKLSVNTPQGMALTKLVESLFIIFTIIIFTIIIEKDLGSIYIKKGKIKLSIIIGLMSFIILTVFVVTQMGESIKLNRMIPFMPWILIFVISNGLMEELLFRGLFLRKYSSFLGLNLSNLLAATIFTLSHISVKYVPNLPVFLITIFLFALAWGFVIQKTDNIWGAALFHAGATMGIIIPFFLQYTV
jgi:membrane protease YdiL (CAAX protease family)